MILPQPANEAERLETLREYQILDSTPEDAFDDIVLLASYVCETSIAIISLIDEARQWFKSKIGIEIQETPRDVAFCSHAILQSDIMIVPDALSDDRFATNPLVISEPQIRFYAGAPLITSNGSGLGTLCVIDQTPRRLTEAQGNALQALARKVVSELELRRTSRLLQKANLTQQHLIKELEDALAQIETLEGIIPICANCKNVRNDSGYWQQVEAYVTLHSKATFSHGVCPSCMNILYPEYDGDVQAGEE